MISESYYSIVTKLARGSAFEKDVSIRKIKIGKQREGRHFVISIGQNIYDHVGIGRINNLCAGYLLSGENCDIAELSLVSKDTICSGHFS